MIMIMIIAITINLWRTFRPRPRAVVDARLPREEALVQAVAHLERELPLIVEPRRGGMTAKPRHGARDGDVHADAHEEEEDVGAHQQRREEEAHSHGNAVVVLEVSR